MKWYVYTVLSTIINTFLIITIVDVLTIGAFVPRFSKKCRISHFLVNKENRIDLQKGNACSGYASAYILRHHGIPASGMEVYAKMPHKTPNGNVPPRSIKKVLKGYGFHVKYCMGNLDALKEEVCKGNPVIVFIRSRPGKRWLHFVPVVGYDEGHLFLADSVKEFVNCSGGVYNREISNKDFLALWNTSMLKMPLYTHTFFIIEQNSR